VGASAVESKGVAASDGCRSSALDASGDWPAARIWSGLAVVLPPAPFVLSALLALLLPAQPTQPGSQPDMTSLLILPAAVTAIAALALLMNWRISGDEGIPQLR